MDWKKKDTALNRAIDMEEEGKQFYLKAAKNVQSPLARIIFEEFARDEDSHIKKIREIHGRLKEQGSIGEWVTSVSGPFRSEKIFQESLIKKAKASTGDMDTLRFALDREEKSEKYYEDLSRETSETIEKRFYQTLAYEERGHYLKVLDAIEYLLDPEGWFRIKEKNGLDGG